MFSIPDLGSEFFPSRIRIKKLKYFNPKNWFLSSRKYDPGCSSRLRILFFTHPGSRIPGSKKHRSQIPDPNIAYKYKKRVILDRGSPVHLAQPVLVGVVRVEVVGELLGALLDQVGGDALHAGGGRPGPREKLVYEQAGKLVAPH
jgi:hypothetical protein